MSKATLPMSSGLDLNSSISDSKAIAVTHHPASLFCRSQKKPGSYFHFLPHHSGATQSNRMWTRVACSSAPLKSLPLAYFILLPLTWRQPSSSPAPLFLSSNQALHLEKVHRSYRPLVKNPSVAMHHSGQEQAFPLSNRPLSACLVLQLVFITYRFLICEFTDLLTLICNPQIYTLGAFAVIHRHVQRGGETDSSNENNPTR